MLAPTARHVFLVGMHGRLEVYVYMRGSAGGTEDRKQSHSAIRNSRSDRGFRLGFCLLSLLSVCLYLLPWDLDLGFISFA